MQKNFKKVYKILKRGNNTNIKDLKNRKNFENICLIIRPVVFYLFTGFLILYFVVLYEVLTV